MKFWYYYIIAGLLLLHPHFAQKMGMLYDYFSHPDYLFFTTFSMMDLLDLLLHGGIPLALIIFGILKQRKEKKQIL